MRISEIKTTNPMRNQKERMDLRERETEGQCKSSGSGRWMGEQQWKVDAGEPR
jgi:hypothetical protein